MRQAFAARRQAVFLVARHFAEGPRMTVVGRRAGTSDRSRSLGRRAAARPACRRRAPRIPRDDRPARRRTAPRRNAPCGVGSASSRRARGVSARSSPWRRQSPYRGRPSAPNRSRARHQARRPRARNRRQKPAVSSPFAAACALMRALSRNVIPVSSGSLQPQLARRYGVDAIGRKQFAHFGELSRIVRRDHQTARDVAMFFSAHITAIFCRSTSLVTPLRASARSAENCSSENGVFSAVAWISTILPEPVRTKLASVSACESSA